MSRVFGVFRGVLGVLMALAAGGCGECVFEVQVDGSVVDPGGAPLAGVEVSVCQGERCASSEADDACVSVVTDAAGRFTLEVPQCRPEPFQCELRPLVLRREGCEDAVVRVGMEDEVQVVEYTACPLG
ncbi:MAG: carboxypeptidase regulatory-like domain-containing protein [Myxococcales bacterium]|nr:carboxypeptidase regulatory-like domain-containing protein [Myxococcales bacterium]